jgi:molybdopterin-binding protein
MKISARNRLKGTIVTSSITNEAVDELKLSKGMTAYAVIKASDVMVAID